MQYTTVIEIDLDREKVAELFANPSNYSSWQDSLIKQEIVEGEPGKIGTRTKIEHKLGKRKIEMIETITGSDLPNLFTATYVGKGVWNEAINRFSRVKGNKTRWEMKSEFRFSGFMWVMSKLLPMMFKKQTRRTMLAFKNYAEKRNNS